MLPVEVTEEFKGWILQRLTDEGLTVRDASLRIGLSDSHLGKILRGQVPGPEAIIKIADFFDEPREKLFYLAGYLKHDPSERPEIPPELLNFVRSLMALPPGQRREIVSRLKPVLELALGRTNTE